jgi:2'-hydroxyisoflavone reductase
MRILVLGGTAWVGREVATAALAAGHDVTCLARGSSGSHPDGVRAVRADRDRPDAYDEVADRAWDGVVDVARQPAHVRGAVARLGERTERWAFISTGNVYASHALVGADETADLLEAATADAVGTSPEEYGAGKVACERAVLEGLGERAVIARAGLIGGPGDASGRSGYWPWRFAHPSNDAGAVLAPASRVAASLIDVRDLASWLVSAVEGVCPTGVYDAVANPGTLQDHLAIARSVAGHGGPVVEVDDAWLGAQGVAEWSGPRSLPLWLADPEWQGFAGRRGDRIIAAGLRPRPLAETLADTLAWESSRSVPRGAGLTDEDERALLAAAEEGAA